MSNAAAAQERQASQHHVNPVVAAVLGGVFVGLCGIGLTMEVSSTEACLLGKHVADYAPQWDILNQLPGIFSGGLGNLQGPAFVAWVIAFLYIAMGIVGKVLDESTRAAGKLTAGILRFFVGCILIFDVYTTLNNGPVLIIGGFFGHLACLACVLICVLGFGALGLRLLFNHTLTFLHGNN